MKKLTLFILIILFSTIICTANSSAFDVDEMDDFPNTRLGSENFDIFVYGSKLNNDFILLNNVVNYALNHLIGKANKNQIVDKKKLDHFLEVLSAYYNSNIAPKMNPYHNVYHAADVVHTLYLFLINSKYYNPTLFKDTYDRQINEIPNNIKYNDLDIFALIIAAACHDYKHRGRSNNFYLNYKNKVPFAKELEPFSYKLEKYHFVEAQKLIEEYDLLEYLNKYQKERFYKIMEMVILATDNSLNAKHAEMMMAYKEIIQLKSIVTIQDIINLNTRLFMKEQSSKVEYPNLSIDEIKLLEFEWFLHAADISNAAKKKDIFLAWSFRINEEICFESIEINSFDETKDINCIGDDEDKFRKSQLQFFENIIEVFFRPLCEVFDYLNYLCFNYDKNKAMLEGKEKIFN